MRRMPRLFVVPAIATTAFLATGSAAFGKSSSFIDLEIGAGYSSNPLLQQDSTSSAFGRISASAAHSWQSERGATTLSAYVENTTYLKDYGSKQIFDLAAHTGQNLSPNVSVYGDIDFSGDFAGQLSNRVLTVPSQPPVTEPGNPLPPPTNLPDVFGLTGRQYRLNGQVGASIRSSARTNVSLSAGAQRVFFSGHGTGDEDYNVYFGSVGISQQLSERTSAGGTVFLQRQDFTHGDYSNIVNPTATLHTQLSERFSADLAAGVIYVEQSGDDGKDHSWSPSFSGSLCRSTSLDHFCAHISRDAQSALSSRVESANGNTSVSTTAGVDYFRQLGEGQSLQLSLSGVRYSTIGTLADERFRSTYLSAVAGYDRKIGNRLYAGVAGGARRLFQDGPDPDTDLNVNLYLRYRLGDLL